MLLGKNSLKITCMSMMIYWYGFQSPRCHHIPPDHLYWQTFSVLMILTFCQLIFYIGKAFCFSLPNCHLKIFYQNFFNDSYKTSCQKSKTIVSFTLKKRKESVIAIYQLIHKTEARIKFKLQKISVIYFQIDIVILKVKKKLEFYWHLLLKLIDLL